MPEPLPPQPVSVFEIGVRFNHHPPSEDQQNRMATLRSAYKELALLLVDLTPPSREQSLALTALEQVGLYANAAIARRE